MRVVVSIGGSVLLPTVDFDGAAITDRVDTYADTLADIDEEHHLGVVVGGGPTAREYIGAARTLGANEIELDQMGVAVTRLNARLLLAALGDRAAPSPMETHEAARDAIRRGDVPVMGGTVAGHTTDAVATALAEFVDADLVVYATSVAGVFDADPNEDPSASKFESITPAELVDVLASIEMAAGSNAPVDLLAAKLLHRSDLRGVVVDGTDPATVVDAVAGTHDGTDIISG